VEALILERLRNRFPEHQVIAEESSGEGTTDIDEFCWAVDPLDGTVNFAMGIPFFAVSLALLYHGHPVVGCVYDPVRRELFRAERGGGSFVNDQRLRIRPDAPVEAPAQAGSPPDISLPGTPPGQAGQAAPVGVSSGFLEQQARGGLDFPWLPVFERYGKVRVLGSQALHLCYVAAGRLQAAINWESRLWDDAAGALVVQEAGARYTGFEGEPVFPLEAGSRVLAGEAIHSVAAVEGAHQEIVALLADTPTRSEVTPDEIAF
jgi:myo-inositol-1(or 4)-monophosphatase